jgi:hypothetical protein
VICQGALGSHMLTPGSIVAMLSSVARPPEQACVFIAALGPPRACGDGASKAVLTDAIGIESIAKESVNLEDYARTGLGVSCWTCSSLSQTD